MITQWLSYKTAAIVAWLVLLFVAERWMPQEETPRAAAPAWRRVMRNIGLWLLNVGLSPLVVLPVSAWAASVSLSWRPEIWSGGGGLLLDIVILDCWIYWWHRANHAVGFLWRFHEVHHLDRFLDTTTALRFHFGEVLLSAAARGVVIWVLGMPMVSVMVFETLVMLASVFHHSNLRVSPWLDRWLAHVLVTPGIHWVHHHALRKDTDSNYGTIFSFWDRMFGSRSSSLRRRGMVLGVENPETHEPVADCSLVRLLLRPLAWQHEANAQKDDVQKKIESKP